MLTHRLLVDAPPSFSWLFFFPLDEDCAVDSGFCDALGVGSVSCDCSDVISVSIVVSIDGAEDYEEVIAGGQCKIMVSLGRSD